MMWGGNTFECRGFENLHWINHSLWYLVFYELFWLNIQEVFILFHVAKNFSIMLYILFWNNFVVRSNKRFHLLDVSTIYDDSRYTWKLYF